MIFRGKYAIIQERKMITVDENRNRNISSEHSEELLNIIENFRLMDDTFMSKVFEDKACAELLLRVILNRDDLTVVRVVSQFELKNLQGRSARLDIYAIDEHGKQYDVEVQRSDDGAAPRRARYNSSLLDANLLNPGDKFDELPESYIIFITEHDVLKGGKPLYTVNRTISELDHAIFTDGSHIIYVNIYVNGEIRNGTALGELMQDFFCKDPRKMHYKVLSDRAGYFKKDKEGVDTMCKLMEDYADKRARQAAEAAAKETAEKAARERSISIATNLWNKGERDLQQIADLTDLPLDEVKKLFEGKTA